MAPRKVPGKPAKWTNNWIGPFRVVQVISEVLLKIKAISGPDRILTVHISRVKPYVGAVGPTRMPAKMDIDDEGSVEVETVRGEQAVVVPTEIRVPVKFVGCGQAEIRERDQQPARGPIPEDTRTKEDTVEEKMEPCPQPQVVQDQIPQEEDVDMQPKETAPIRGAEGGERTEVTPVEAMDRGEHQDRK